MLSEYQKFKSEKDAFWCDIPHEKCEMVTKKNKRKRKHKILHLGQGTQMYLNRPVAKCTAILKRCPRLTKSKLSRKPRGVSDDLQDFSLEGFTHKRDHEHEHFHEHLFPLYIKSRTLYKVEFEQKLNLTKLKEAVETKEKIPSELQILTHNGKLLRCSHLKHLCPGDTIHVIVRGKGGGKSKDKSTPNKECPKSKRNAGLSDVKTEEDVYKWLTNVVHVPETVYQESDLNLLDVDTLQSYSDAKELKEELILPIGIARKILFFKDSPSNIVSGFKTELLESITTDTVASFASECLQNQKNADKIVDVIKEEHIDGLVVMLYEELTDLSADLKISKPIGRKVLINARKNIKEKFDNNIKVGTHAEESILTHASDPLNIAGNDEFLSKVLGLEIVDSTANKQSPECELIAIHSSWEKCNELSQMFLFWVICSQGDFTCKVEKKKLWKAIVRNLPVWLENLPDNLRKDFTPGKSTYRFQYKGSKTVSINEAGEKIRNYNDVSQAEIDNYKTHILILHESVSKHVTPYILLHQGKYVAVNLGNNTHWVYGSEGLRDISTDTNTTCLPEVTEQPVGVCERPDSYALSYHGDMKAKYGELPDSKTPCKETDKKRDDYVSFVCPRRFNQDGSNMVYFRDCVIERPECGSGMIVPSLEFKFFCSSLNTGNEMGPMKKFLTETLRFACGCLNRRRNGTIYFGIADDKPVDGQKYRHGQVVGFPIMEVDSVSKNKYTDELDNAKRSYFNSPEARQAAMECIKSPVFVKVSPSSPDLPLYVMEVDVQPSSHFCKGIKFKLDLSKVLEKKQKPSVYVRDGAETKIIREEVEELQFVSKLVDYDSQRKLEEHSEANYATSTDTDHKYMADKLVRKLCKGSTQFDSTLWPILVSSKPSDDIRKNIYSSLSFISNIHWSAVFEFDDDSWSAGLSKHFFDAGHVTHTDGEIFRDVENNSELRHRLRLPENCVFIYCNGRSDQTKPHLQKQGWKKEYSPRVKGAINFLQQKSVVPLGRAVLICLLFSSDFEGFLDVFGEVTTFFGNEQVLLICADRDIYGRFRTQALLQQILTEDDLQNTCVVGMTWQQTNECINRLLGVENPTITSIPSSCGARVVVDGKVEESLDCLRILSCTQCEDRKFETLKEKKQFSRERELKFYQGNMVEWWNFFFPGHVMDRHCFRKLKSKVHDALTIKKSEQSKVVPIFLLHEPGAGGSTLARHVLWEFRKDFRCAIVTKLVEKTASDILTFWRYKEKDLNFAHPVLLLIDSVPEQKIDLDDLPHRIAKLNIDYPVKSQICVLLICMRDETLCTSMKHSPLPVAESEVLLQKVDDDEKEWLKHKIENLEATSRDLGLTEFKGEYFITFMILHSDFNKVFLQETVKNILKGISFEEKSFKLLLYVALVIAYVSPSKFGAAIAIPIECCSELMGINTRIKAQEHKTNLWENELDGRLKILLVTELKDNGSGKQIRMAHPNLAKTVISCIKDGFDEAEIGSKCKESLAEIALDFLKSDILKTSSYAKTFVIRLSVEMLIRRKKEEYDDGETTNFSPLIESILSESKTYEPAADVLITGFTILKEDCYIAHQVARLYLDKRVFNLAKEWAKRAVDLHPKRSSFIHTLGNVCKLAFLSRTIWDSQDKKKSSDPVVIEALELALEAFEKFAEASSCDKIEINLLACYDVISTANCIAKFVRGYVDIGNSGMIHRYFTDEDFLPESVEGWDKFHKKMKTLYTTALMEVDILDEHIYYSRRSYASKYNQDIEEEHRNSRTIKRKLPDTLLDFATYFGERTDLEMPAYLKSDLMKDGWHRRSVVYLGGKRLVDVFKIVQGAFLKDADDEGGEKMTPLDHLYKVQKHLGNISDKTSDDYLNIIYVNLALAQLSAPKQIGMKELFDYCSQIVRVRRKGNTLNMAYLFTMMFMWPRKKKQEVPYNHGLMMKSLKHLFEEFMVTKQKKPRADNDLFKRENNVFHSIVLFYAAKGRGLSSICHNSQLPTKRKHQEQFWESPHIQEKLRFVNGHTRLRPNSNAVSVVIDLNEFGIDEELEIRNLRCGRVDLTERPISFFLGFSLSGPVVCYIRPKEALSTAMSWLRHTPDYDGLSERQLLSLKSKISDLKKQRHLSDKEIQIISDEKEIDDALLQLKSEEALLD